MPPKRTSMPGQDSPLRADLGSFVRFWETTNCHASGLAASRVGAALAVAQAMRAMPATDFYTCRLTSLPSRGAGRSTIICIRPLAIRRSLVPERPFWPAAALRPTRVNFGRPDQSSARRCRRFTCFVRLPSRCRVLHLFAWGSGVGSAGVHPTRNTQADGAPKVPGAGGHRPRRHLP
jgi:hypothetical protein